MSLHPRDPLSPEELEKVRIIQEDSIRARMIQEAQIREIRARMTEKAALPPNPLSLEGFIFPDNLIPNNLYKLVGKYTFGGGKYWNLVRFVKHNDFFLTLKMLPSDRTVKTSTSLVGLYDINQNVDGIPFRGTPRDLVETMKIIDFERRKHALHAWHSRFKEQLANELLATPEGAATGGAGKGGGKSRRKKKPNKRKSKTRSTN